MRIQTWRAGWYRTMASDATSHSRANDFCPLHMTVCKCARDVLAHAGSADQHECPSVVLASPLRDLQETFCARYALDNALPLPHSSDTHHRACLHALHAHKMPQRCGRSPCLSATLRRRAPGRPSRARFRHRKRRASSSRSGPHPTARLWHRRLLVRLPDRPPDRLSCLRTTACLAKAKMRDQVRNIRTVCASCHD